MHRWLRILSRAVLVRWAMTALVKGRSFPSSISEERREPPAMDRLRPALTLGSGVYIVKFEPSRVRASGSPRRLRSTTPTRSPPQHGVHVSSSRETQPCRI